MVDDRALYEGMVNQYSRMLQFKAGPNQTVFNACEKHKDCLTERELLPDLFFADEKDIVEISLVDESEVDCWFCDGENGP